MANPMNLLTDSAGNSPLGGWELMCLDNDLDGADCGDTCPDFL